MESANTGTLIPEVEILRDTKTRGLHVRVNGETLDAVIYFSAAIGEREGWTSGKCVRIETIQDVYPKTLEVQF